MAEATAVLERIDTPRTQEDPVDIFLKTVSDYLNEKKAAAYRPDSPEDLNMRLKGASCQQKVAGFVLLHHDDSSAVREEISSNFLRSRLTEFYRGYHLLVLQPLIDRGFDLKKIPKDTGLEFVLSFKKGVIGVVATCLLAKNCGWTYSFPSVEDDVRRGHDLIIRKSEQEAVLQVKYKQEASKLIVSGRPGQPIYIVIPGANPGFFHDDELGIPRWSEAKKFGAMLDNQLRGRR